MTSQEHATALEQACDLFLLSYRDALPRIARRGFQPILDELDKLLEATGQDVTMVFRYPIENGQRAPSTTDSSIWGNLVYSKSRKAFGFGVTVKMLEMPRLRLEIGLPGFREVTMEDIVELSVQPWEIAEFLKGEATKASFIESAKQATQPMAKA